MVARLFQALSRTRARLLESLRGQISPATRETLEARLISADMSLDTVDALLTGMDREASGDLLPALRRELMTLLKNIPPAPEPPSGPSVLIVVGVNGSGKTTTAAKLAHYYHSRGQSVLLVGADTYRAAAVEQLQVWARRAGVRLVYNQQARQPSAVLFDGLSAARSQAVGLVVVDTAGRLHTYKNLMRELEKMVRVVEQHFPEYSLKAYLTVDANLGQNSLLQARAFTRHMPLTGAILTKLDGTGKGGIVFSLYQELGLPVEFIGLGEGLEDLQPFNAEEYVDGLLGTG